MQRRNFTRALAASLIPCSVTGVVHAQSQAAPKQAASSRPFRSVNVPEDGRRVLFFFDFACPFCATYHQPLMNFAATVPGGIQTMFVPVVSVADVARRNEQILAAKCYYAAFAVATKAQMGRFASSVYESFQLTRSLVSKEIWAKAVASAGINMKAFAAALNAQNTETQILYAALKVNQYALTATPSVGVGGKYVLTPDDVVGDQQMFFNILNGLASEIL